MDKTDKYLRHLTPVFMDGWKDCILSDLVAMVKDKELPEKFRHKLKMELIETKKELTVLLIKYGNNQP